MRVSVVMSVYNGEKYLEESIRSILDQTFRDFEFIIINDGSTDGTKCILDERMDADSRIKVIHRDNHGLTTALNLGASLAKGEYISRQDADDVSCPSRLMRQVELLDSLPDVVLCASSQINIDSDGRFLSYSKREFSSKNVDVARLRNRPAHGSWMFRKNAFEKAGGYREEFRYAQDLDLFLRLSGVGVIESVVDPLYKLRLHRGAIGVSKKQAQDRYARLAFALHDIRIGLDLVDNGWTWRDEAMFQKMAVKQKLKGLFQPSSEWEPYVSHNR